jgi:hypothetical protein
VAREKICTHARLSQGEGPLGMTATRDRLGPTNERQSTVANTPSSCFNYEAVDDDVVAARMEMLWFHKVERASLSLAQDQLRTLVEAGGEDDAELRKLLDGVTARVSGLVAADPVLAAEVHAATPKLADGETSAIVLLLAIGQYTGWLDGHIALIESAALGSLALAR